MAKAGPVSNQKGFSLTLPKAEAAVEDGRLAVLEYLAPLNFDSKIINRIEVVLEELVSNVVRHASEATHVQLSVDTCKEGITLSIEDDGAAFNPLEGDVHRSFDKLDDAQLGGLGIPLVKRLSQSVKYDRVGGENRVCATIAT